MKKSILALLLCTAFAAQAQSLAADAGKAHIAMKVKIVRCGTEGLRTDWGQPYTDCVDKARSEIKDSYTALEAKVKKPSAKAALKVMFAKGLTALSGTEPAADERMRAYDERQARLMGQVDEAWSMLELDL